jgi:hypothetical protein
MWGSWVLVDVVLQRRKDMGDALFPLRESILKECQAVLPIAVAVVIVAAGSSWFGFLLAPQEVTRGRSNLGVLDHGLQVWRIHLDGSVLLASDSVTVPCNPSRQGTGFFFPQLGGERKEAHWRGKGRIEL